jgi:hypothetical protein
VPTKVEYASTNKSLDDDGEEAMDMAIVPAKVEDAFISDDDSLRRRWRLIRTG